jgi:hypothetical protein
MADTMVENPAQQVLPHRKQIPSSIPNIDSLEGLGTDGSDEYSTLKKLQRHLELVLFYAPIEYKTNGHVDISNFKKNTSRMSNGSSLPYHPFPSAS